MRLSLITAIIVQAFATEIQTTKERDTRRRMLAPLANMDGVRLVYNHGDVILKAITKKGCCVRRFSGSVFLEVDFEQEVLSMNNYLPSGVLPEGDWTSVAHDGDESWVLAPKGASSAECYPKITVTLHTLTPQETAELEEKERECDAFEDHTWDHDLGRNAFEDDLGQNAFGDHTWDHTWDHDRQLCQTLDSIDALDSVKPFEHSNAEFDFMTHMDSEISKTLVYTVHNEQKFGSHIRRSSAYHRTPVETFF